MVILIGPRISFALQLACFSNSYSIQPFNLCRVHSCWKQQSPSPLIAISHNVWQIPEVVRVGTSIRSKSPTRWGNNLGGGRQAESRESASYARALAPSTAGVKDPEEHRVRYETSSCWILVLLFLLSWTLKISSSSIY